MRGRHPYTLRHTVLWLLSIEGTRVRYLSRRYADPPSVDRRSPGAHRQGNDSRCRHQGQRHGLLLSLCISFRIFHCLQKSFFRSGCRKEDSSLPCSTYVSKSARPEHCVSLHLTHVFGPYCTGLSYFFIHTGPLRPSGSKAYESTYNSRYCTLVWFRCKRRRVPT